MTLTFIICTNRDHPELQWFMDSLSAQLYKRDKVTVFIIRPSGHEFAHFHKDILIRHIVMKPTVWAGEHRITKTDFWSKANSINTGLCLATTDYVCMVDDRSVLMPGWVERVREAITNGGYVLCGRYEKRTGLKVENGIITHSGIVTGVDGRFEFCEKNFPAAQPPFDADKGWTYGCSVLSPLEWLLNINGVDETLDGLGYEDCFIGMLLHNSGYKLKYDPRMLLIQDRTPEFCGPVVRREDYGKSPNDWSHKIMDRLKDRKTTLHPFNLRDVRKDALSGKGWPKPWGPLKHAWHGVPLEEL